MIRKIMCMGIISIFLLVSLSSVSAIETKTDGENEVDFGEVISYKKVTRFFFFTSPDFYVEEKTATLSEWNQNEPIIIKISTKLEPYSFFYKAVVVDFNVKAKLDDYVLFDQNFAVMGSDEISFSVFDEKINQGDTINVEVKINAAQLYSPWFRMTLELEEDDYSNNEGVCSFSIL